MDRLTRAPQWSWSLCLTLPPDLSDSGSAISNDSILSMSVSFDDATRQPSGTLVFKPTPPGSTYLNQATRPQKRAAQAELLNSRDPPNVEDRSTRRRKVNRRSWRAISPRASPQQGHAILYVAESNVDTPATQATVDAMLNLSLEEEPSPSITADSAHAIEGTVFADISRTPATPGSTLKTLDLLGTNASQSSSYVLHPHPLPPSLALLQTAAPDKCHFRSQSSEAGRTEPQPGADFSLKPKDCSPESLQLVFTADTQGILKPPNKLPEGPAMQLPYLPATSQDGTVVIRYSSRPGGPKLYDLIDLEPPDKFGPLKWFVLEKEEVNAAILLT
jgi:hypothetical protein